MKELQSAFTTPEQSKLLLELGVPRFTADCYYGCYSRRENMKVMVIDNGGTQYKVINRNDIIPCWSVGRLQEIFAICYTGEQFYMWCNSGFYLCDNIIEGMELRKEQMDFSKLED